MSYDIAKSFSVNEKNFSFKGSFASNNVTPRTYEPWETKINPKERFKNYEAYQTGLLNERDLFRIWIVEAIVGGNIKLSKSVYVKYRYALMKLNERLDDAPKRIGFYSLASRAAYRTTTSRFDESIAKEDYPKRMYQLKELADYFFSFLRKKVPTGKFIVQLEQGYLYKENITNYKYSFYESGAKRFKNRWEAELAAKNLNGRVIELKKD